MEQGESQGAKKGKETNKIYEVKLECPNHISSPSDRIGPRIQATTDISFRFQGTRVLHCIGNIGSPDGVGQTFCRGIGSSNGDCAFLKRRN
jgi:hypothetical protein